MLDWEEVMHAGKQSGVLARGREVLGEGLKHAFVPHCILSDGRGSHSLTFVIISTLVLVTTSLVALSWFAPLTILPGRARRVPVRRAAGGRVRPRRSTPVRHVIGLALSITWAGCHLSTCELRECQRGAPFLPDQPQHYHMERADVPTKLDPIMNLCFLFIFCAFWDWPNID
jgi:hypothetical protein